MSEPIIAELWTIKLVCQKGCPVPDDACDNAGHPYGYRITYNADEWKKPRAAERVNAFESEEVDGATRMPNWEPPIVRIPSLSTECDGPVVDEEGRQLWCNNGTWGEPWGTSRLPDDETDRQADLDDLIFEARQLIESCPHLRFEEMTC